MQTLETVELQALRGVDEHTALRLQEEVGETFTMFCQKGQEMTPKDFAKLCRERCLFSLDFTPVDAEILFLQEVPVRSKRMDVQCFKSALVRIAQKKGIEVEHIFQDIAESGGPLSRVAKNSKSLPSLHNSAGRRSLLPAGSPMQAAMHFRRTSSGLTDSEGLLRAELHSRRSSPSWTGSEGLTASEALSEFYDSEAGEQHNVVNLRPHVKDISPISSTRSTEDGADQGQMRCAHNFRSKNRISATSCLDLHSRLP